GEQLKELQSRHRIVSSIRGIGMMRVLDLKKDPSSGKEFAQEDDLSHLVPKFLRDHGLLSRGGASIQVAPPLVINREEVDELVDALDQTVSDIEGHFSI